MASTLIAPLVGSVVGGIFADDNGAEDANNAAAAATNQQSAIAKDQWDTYKSIYQPMEKQFVADAQNYDSVANRERAAGEAAATVSQQYGKARDRLSRTPGLDPSSAAFTSAIAGLDMNQAAADAVGQNAARNKVKDMAWARKTDALSLGKGLPAAASAGLAQSANASANLAQMGYRNQANEAAGIGTLVSNGINAFNNSGGFDMFSSPTKSTFVPPTNNYVIDPVNVPSMGQIGLGDFTFG